MATFSPEYSSRPQRDAAVEHDDPEASHFLTGRQLAWLTTLGAAAWVAVLGPFLF